MNFTLTPAETEALLLSLKVSTVAVFCALPFALAAALLLARGRFFGRNLLNGLLHLPLVLPPVVIGYLLLVVLGTRAPLGAWLLDNLGIRFAFSWIGAALASAIITFPFQLRAIRLSLEAADPGLSAAAATLGASRLDRLATITLPLAIPGIISGLITAFAASLGEFGAIITFVSNIPGVTRTLPLAIFTAIQSPGGEWEAARLCAISVAIAIVAVLAAELLTARARTAIAR